MPLRLAISLGDITGIGPEVTLKALAAELNSDDTHYLLIGDAGGLQQLNDQLHLGLTLGLHGQAKDQSRICVHSSPAGLPAALAPGDARAALAALDWLKEGAQLGLRGEADALVTAPVNKEAIMLAKGANWEPRSKPSFTQPFRLPGARVMTPAALLPPTRCSITRCGATMTRSWPCITIKVWRL